MTKRLCSAVCMASFLVVWQSVAFATDGPVQLKKATSEARISLQQAIELVQKEIPNGTIVEGGLEWSKSPTYYELDMLVDRKWKEVIVDAGTGKILRTELHEPERGHGEEEVADKLRAAGAFKLGLSAAITTLEKKYPTARPIAIQVGMDGDRPWIQVVLFAADRFRQTAVDGITGETLHVEDTPIPLLYWLFDDESAGQLPTGLMVQGTRPNEKPDTWKIAPDPGAPTQPNVLTRTTRENGDTREIAIMDKTSFRDLDLRVLLRADAGNVAQGGGLIWRCKDANNHYMCRINPLEGNISILKMHEGKRRQLKSANVETHQREWYKMRIVMNGDRISCYLDSTKLLEVQDGTFKDAGMIGLWAEADASSSFDSLTVFPPPPK